ncbi:MAG: hypothetical protein U0837_04960 [Dehalococcoidia bacterium]
MVEVGERAADVDAAFLKPLPTCRSVRRTRLSRRPWVTAPSARQQEFRLVEATKTSWRERCKGTAKNLSMEVVEQVTMREAIAGAVSR